MISQRFWSKPLKRSSPQNQEHLIDIEQGKNSVITSTLQYLDAAKTVLKEAFWAVSHYRKRQKRPEGGDNDFGLMR